MTPFLRQEALNQTKRVSSQRKQAKVHVSCLFLTIEAMLLTAWAPASTSPKWRTVTLKCQPNKPSPTLPFVGVFITAAEGIGYTGKRHRRTRSVGGKIYKSRCSIPVVRVSQMQAFAKSCSLFISNLSTILWIPQWKIIPQLKKPQTIFTEMSPRHPRSESQQNQLYNIHCTLSGLKVITLEIIAK